MSEIAIATYTTVPELYRISTAFLDLPHHRIALRNWTGIRCVADLLAIDADWVVHIDEDAFLFAPKRLRALISYMERNGYACAGMPDGGVVPHRLHNPIACNPFFLVIHRQALLDVLASDPDVTSARWQESYRTHVATFVGDGNVEYYFDNFEPFYGFFFWLCKHGRRILYLNADQWQDEPEGVSTILNDQEGVPFVLHTWYSREYKRNPSSLKGLVAILARGILAFRPWYTKGVHYHRIRHAMAGANQLREINKQLAGTR